MAFGKCQTVTPFWAILNKTKWQLFLPFWPGHVERGVCPPPAVQAGPRLPVQSRRPGDHGVDGEDLQDKVSQARLGCRRKTKMINLSPTFRNSSEVPSFADFLDGLDRQETHTHFKRNVKFNL